MEEETKIPQETQEETKSPDPTPSEVFERIEYSKPEFWNDRFREQPKAFDWYISWAEFKKYIILLDPPRKVGNVLMVGSGNSTLSNKMANCGYFVTNIDISDVVLNAMRQDNQDYVQLDATLLPFRDQSFDLVIDKGTFDALACDTVNNSSDKLVAEMGRVCRGTLIIVTHGKPAARIPRFRSQLPAEWEVRDFKAELSPMAQIINIMRSKFPDRSLGNIMKDKAMFTQCILELGSYMEERKKKRDEARAAREANAQPEEEKQNEEKKAEVEEEKKAEQEKVEESDSPSMR